MPTIIATIGAVNANSYVTLAEANAYHDERLHNEAWTSADDPTKIAALLWAARTLDRLSWLGEKVTVDQGMRWPRYSVYDQDGYLIDSTTIPKIVKEAQSELAFLLISNDRTVESGTEGFKKIKVGPIELEIDPSDRIDAISYDLFETLNFLVSRGLCLERG